MNYEELQIQACKDGIEIVEYPLIVAISKVYIVMVLLR